MSEAPSGAQLKLALTRQISDMGPPLPVQRTSSSAGPGVTPGASPAQLPAPLAPLQHLAPLQDTTSSEAKKRRRIEPVGATASDDSDYSDEDERYLCLTIPQTPMTAQPTKNGGLHAAVKSESAAVLSVALLRTASDGKVPLDAANSEGYTPLMTAAAIDNPQVRGVAPAQRVSADSDGCTYVRSIDRPHRWWRCSSRPARTRSLRTSRGSQVTPRPCVLFFKSTLIARRCLSRQGQDIRCCQRVNLSACGACIF